MDIQELCKAYSSFFDVDATFSSYAFEDNLVYEGARQQWCCKVIVNEKVIFKTVYASESLIESEKQAVSQLERSLFNHAIQYGIKLLNEHKG